MIPTYEQGLELLDRYNVPENVKNHCKNVNRVAVFLAKKLQEKGIDINVELVSAASLLHDVGREGKQESYPKPKHIEEGYNRLKEKYPEVAHIVRIHDMMRIEDAKTWEEKIVNYSDKRAWERKIVTLEKRFKSLEERYLFKLPEEINDLYHKIEKEIFDIIGIKPEKLGEQFE
jgi:putative nucleotidyltransferase with HDIG domain